MTNERLIGNILIMISAVPAVASVIVCAATPWRDTPVGRHLMAYMAVIAAVLAESSIAVWMHPPRPMWFELLRIATFLAVPVVLCWRLYLQIQAPRRLPTPKRRAEK